MAELKYVAEFRWIGFFLCTVGASHVDFAVADGGKRTHALLTHTFVGRFFNWNRPIVSSHCWICPSCILNEWLSLVVLDGHLSHFVTKMEKTED